MRWMCLVGALLSAAGAAAEDSATFLFELRGVPVGTVELRWDRTAGTYRYTSTQLFTRQGDRRQRTRVATFDVDAAGRDRRTGRIPEGLALWRGRASVPKGAPCVDAVEEFEKTSGTVCFSGEGQGSAFGERFRAEYGAEGLRLLVMDSARFVRVPRGTAVPPPPDVFARGFPVDGAEGVLALDPPLGPDRLAISLRPAPSARVARSLAHEVTGSFDDQRASAADFKADPEATAASCLGHALRYRERAKQRGFDAAIVHGLVVLDGETVARPHAWVRVRIGEDQFLDLDPTLDAEVRGLTHLPLAVAVDRSPSGAGLAWLNLLSGRHRVLRR